MQQMTIFRTPSDLRVEGMQMKAPRVSSARAPTGLLRCAASPPVSPLRAVNPLSSFPLGGCLATPGARCLPPPDSPARRVRHADQGSSFEGVLALSPRAPRRIPRQSLCLVSRSALLRVLTGLKRAACPHPHQTPNKDAGAFGGGDLTGKRPVFLLNGANPPPTPALLAGAYLPSAPPGDAETRARGYFLTAKKQKAKLCKSD